MQLKKKVSVYVAMHECKCACSNVCKKASACGNVCKMASVYVVMRECACGNACCVA